MVARITLSDASWFDCNDNDLRLWVAGFELWWLFGPGLRRIPSQDDGGEKVHSRQFWGKRGTILTERKI